MANSLFLFHGVHRWVSLSTYLETPQIGSNFKTRGIKLCTHIKLIMFQLFSSLVLVIVTDFSLGFEHNLHESPFRKTTKTLQETDDLATIQRVVNSVRRNTGLSEACETEVSELWKDSQIQISFPRISQDEFNDICQEDSGQNLTCELSSTAFYAFFSERCVSAGGKVIDMDLTIGNDCYDSSRSISSSATFKNLGTCGGISCEDAEFYELVEGILNRSLKSSSSCSFDVSSTSQETIAKMVVLASLVTITMGFL